MLNKRERSLLEVFIEHPNTYLTSKELARVVGVSDRTARKYIKTLMNEIKVHGADIEAKQGLGYKFAVTHELEFNLFLEDELQPKMTKQNSTIDNSIDRQHFILNKLFFEETDITSHKLEELLYVSKSTLSKSINKIKRLLSQYNLELDNYRGSLSVVGAEQNKRHFMLDYFFTDKFDESLSSFIGTSFIDEEINFAELTIIVLDECREAELKLSDYVIHNLVLHIALTIKRIKSGYSLEQFTVNPTIKQSVNYSVAERILNRIETTTNIKFPEEEANYIALHLKVKSGKESTETKLFMDRNQQLSVHIQEILEQLDNELQTNFKTDPILLNGLLDHFTSLLNRVQSDIHLTNPLLDDIQSSYNDILELTEEYFSRLLELTKFNISIDEWAYISLHLMAAMERYANRQKTKVLVVCATGFGSAQMLKTRLEKELSGLLNIIDVISYYELNEEKMSDIDLIISSISLNNVVFPVPVVHVSVFLSREDVDKIKDYVDQTTELNQSFNRQAHSNQDELEKLQLFDHCFSKEQFLLINKTIKKEDLVGKMIEQLKEYNGASFKQQFIEQIKLRNSYSPTVFGENIAFPHPMTPQSYDEQIVVAIIPEGLYWDEEHPAVNFVFLMSPSKIKNEHIKLVSPILVKLLEDTASQQQLLANPNFNEFKKTFIRLMDKR